MFFSFHLLRRVNWHGIVGINVGELDSFVPQLLVHLDNSLQFGLCVECVSPDLDHAQDLFLHSCRRIVLRPDQLHQFLDEFFVRDKNVKVFAAIFNASFQHCQCESGGKNCYERFRLKCEKKTYKITE